MAVGCALVLVTTGCVAEDRAGVASAAVRRDGGPPGNAVGRRRDAGVDSGIDAGRDAGIDSGVDSGIDSGIDAGSIDAGIDAGAADARVDAATHDAGSMCTSAQLVWFEDFETGDDSRWTGGDYDESWGNQCQSTWLCPENPHTGVYSQRSEIVCALRGGQATEHRGYGALQFSGGVVLPEFTNTGTGIVAPYGIVTTFWTWISTPSYDLGDGRWVSLFTVNPTCDYSERPLTLGIDQPDNRLYAAHWWPEGTRTIVPGAPVMPEGEWARITVYLNLETGVMHTWQDGLSVEHITGIVRESHTYCQWHWGLYASGDNYDVVLFEDDKTIWKLLEPWTDFSQEPYFGVTVPLCDPSLGTLEGSVAAPLGTDRSAGERRTRGEHPRWGCDTRPPGPRNPPELLPQPQGP